MPSTKVHRSKSDNVKALLTNLFDNATKFSSQTAAPRVEFGFEKGAYYVQDNGIGIDPKYAEQIFHPFERLHRPNEYPGTGIGLATVQRIIHKHGGRIWAEAQVGKGAAFYFSLATSAPAVHDGERVRI
jgi:hypothetical protein